MWCFNSPSRGGTKQLKADTVALAQTWQGVPHTAAEIFPGENPTPNTCTSLPPRQPLKTKLHVHDLRRKSSLCNLKLKSLLSCCASSYMLQSAHNWFEALPPRALHFVSGLQGSVRLQPNATTSLLKGFLKRNHFI
jgi:hypothetical protein